MTAVYLLAISVLGISLSICLYWVVLLRKKNRRLFSMIARYARGAGEGSSYPASVKHDAEGDGDSLRRQFIDLDGLVRREKLYLIPDVSRDSLVAKTGINKNRLAMLIQMYSGNNLSGYLNSLRLEHSLKMLSEGNETIESVAYDSGFNNVRTFYRIFREEFGMTPAEYRNSSR